MVKRVGFAVPVVYNGKDLLLEIRELAALGPDEVIATGTEKAPMGKGKECEIKDRDGDDTICILRAADEERIERILKSARIEQEQ